jgi:hypothetical protein
MAALCAAGIAAIEAQRVARMQAESEEKSLPLAG